MRITSKLNHLRRHALAAFWITLHRAAPAFVCHPSASSFYNREPNFRTGKHEFYPGPWPSERVTLRAIYCVEFYTPSSLSLAISRLVRLGWDQPTETQESVLDWLKNFRREGSSGAWRNLGTISRKPVTFFNRDFHSPSSNFPSLFSAATGQIYAISPSLTAIVFTFVLPDEDIGIIHEELQKPYFAEARPNSLRKSITLLEPSRIRQEAIVLKRFDFRISISQWLKENIGGFFGESGRPVPCV